MSILDKVWIDENNTCYPGIIKSRIDTDKYIVLKYDTIIWRKVVVDAKCLRVRKDDFSAYMFEARKRFLTENFIFNLQ